MLIATFKHSESEICVSEVVEEQKYVDFHVIGLFGEYYYRIINPRRTVTYCDIL
jgi:hypothetical protein